MNLFQTGFFTLSSGKTSWFKIDCDALTDGDIRTLALMLVDILPLYGSVEGVPNGGLRLAEEMKKHIVYGSLTLLIVDDVYTTGGSMERHRQQSLHTSYDIVGAVIFARSETPDWITPLFRMKNG